MTPLTEHVEMKDSGTSWLGSVPVSWEVIPAGRLFEEEKRKNTQNKYSNAFSFRYGEIVPKTGVDPDDSKEVETLNAYRIVSPDTIMINGLNLNYDFISQRVAIVKETGIITSAYLAVVPHKNEINPQFALYLFKAYDYKQVFHGTGSGIRKTLKYKDFSKLPVPYPKYKEQIAIVDYLNTHCAKIDAMIAAAKANIEDYKALKQSVITQAVTKGLDPNVEMKDSGIEWIGKIPIHWKKCRIKNFGTIQSGINITSLDIKEDDIYPVYGGNGQRGFYSKYTNDGEHVLIGRQGALAGNVHIVSGKFWATDHALVLYNSGLACNRLLFYLLQAMNLNQYAFDTAAQPGLAVSKINLLPTFITPDKKEQTNIVSYLDSQCLRIENLISAQQALIDDLESAKKSLIFECVTGKRKVSD